MNKNSCISYTNNFLKIAVIYFCFPSIVLSHYLIQKVRSDRKKKERETEK